jgi:hypothetical protein
MMLIALVQQGQVCGRINEDPALRPSRHQSHDQLSVAFGLQQSFVLMLGDPTGNA